MKTYSPSELPRVSPDDNSFSVDVICVDDEGMMCIAHYDFDLEQWTFLTDCLYEGYKDVMVWAYRPEEFIAPKVEREEAVEYDSNRWGKDEFGEYFIDINGDKEYFPF